MKKHFLTCVLSFFALASFGQSSDATLNSLNTSSIQGKTYSSTSAYDLYSGIISSKLNVDRIGVTVQAYNAQLAQIAALAGANDDYLQRKAGAWTNRTVAQVKTDLGISNVTFSGPTTGRTYTLPDANASLGTKQYGVACSDLVTALTTGTSKAYFRVPKAFTVTAIRASLLTAQASGSILTINVKESGTTILSTKVTLDNTEATSQTAATPYVISDTSLADDAIITIDIDQVGTGGLGLIVWIIGY